MRWVSQGLVEFRVDLNARDEQNAVRVPGSVVAGSVSVGDSVRIWDEDGGVRGRATVIGIDARSGAGTLVVAWETMRRVEGEQLTPWPFSVAAGDRMRRVSMTSRSSMMTPVAPAEGTATASVGEQLRSVVNGVRPADQSGGVPMQFNAEQGRR